MERGGRHFEAESHQKQGNPRQKDSRPQDQCRVEEGLRSVHGCGAGGGEYQGDAVQEHRRGERPQQEILESSLVGTLPLARKAGKNVKADRKHL